MFSKDKRTSLFCRIMKLSFRASLQGQREELTESNWFAFVYFNIDQIYSCIHHLYDKIPSISKWLGNNIELQKMINNIVYLLSRVTKLDDFF